MSHLKHVNLTPRESSRRRAAERNFSTALLLGVGLAGAATSAFAQGYTIRTVVPATCDSLVAAKIAALPKTDVSSVAGWSRVIVHFNSGTLAPSAEKSLTALGGDIYDRLPLINSVAIRVPNHSLRKLVALPFVAHISLDGNVVKNDEFTVEGTGADTAYSQYGLDGSGVGVAVLDSGIKNHPDLHQANGGPTRVLAAVNFSTDVSVADNCGHGTHIAGIIGGNGAGSSGPKNFQTFYGIARNANLVNVRVLDGQGQGSVSSVISGITWVIKHANTYNIRVLNLSLGHMVADKYTNDPLCQAVEAAYRSGIVVVCAAGNNGRANATEVVGVANEGWGTNYGSIQSPGNDPYVITVGAMKAGAGDRSTDQVATYSSRGPSLYDGILKPDLVAPGNRVISTLANGSYLDNLYDATNSVPISFYTKGNNDNSSKKYFYLSGTSMASPVVAGAAALLIQQDPTLTPDTVKARLMLSADKWVNSAGVSDACTYGAGYLNIPAALNNQSVAGRSALSPSLSRDSKGHVIVDGGLAMWQNGRGNSRTIWGIPGLTNPQAIWGAGAMTNASVVWGSVQQLSFVVVNPSLIYGDQVLWGGSPGDGIGDGSDPAPAPAPTDPTSVDLSSTAVAGEQ